MREIVRDRANASNRQAHRMFRANCRASSAPIYDSERFALLRRPRASGSGRAEASAPERSASTDVKPINPWAGGRYNRYHTRAIAYTAYAPASSIFRPILWCTE